MISLYLNIDFSVHLFAILEQINKVYWWKWSVYSEVIQPRHCKKYSVGII